MDMQLFLFYLVIFVAPFLFGEMLRFFCRRFSKAWLVTVIALVLSAAAWVVATHPPVLGSELYIFRTIQAVCFTIGSLCVALFFKVKEKMDS